MKKNADSDTGASRATRGSRSFLPDVKKPAHKPCSLKRHFIGCLRQVVGYAEKLAANDPERFVWLTEKGFVQQALRRNKKDRYKARQVRYCRQLAEQLGLFHPARRIRNGSMRLGFVVVAHNDVAVSTGSRCILRNTWNPKKRRVRGQKRSDERVPTASPAVPNASSSTIVAGKNACQNASRLSPECRLEVDGECLSRDSQSTPGKQVARSPHYDSTFIEAEKRPSEPSHPVIPEKQSPESINPGTRAPRALSHNLFDLDSDHKLAIREKRETPIGTLKALITGTEADITLLSDGVFDIRSLARYKYTAELLECCAKAIEMLKDRPLLGGRSYAAIMGQAMELLRSDHQLDTPRGWVPVMQTLRKRSAADIARDDQDWKGNWEKAREAENERGNSDRNNPYNIFDPYHSAIAVIDAAAAEILFENPDCRAIFLRLAKKYGVPATFPHAVLFMDEVEKEFESAGLPMGNVLLNVKAKLQPSRKSLSFFE